MSLHEIISTDGQPIPSSATPQLLDMVKQYPFYHAARMAYVHALYNQHDQRFTKELHTAALYVPSRAKLYMDLEGGDMQPTGSTSFRNGATQRRKSQTPIDASQSSEDRTGALIDQFLQTSPILLDTRSGRPVDASTDYMSYLLQEEASKQQEPITPPPSDGQQDLIDVFISAKGDQRIRLSAREENELQKPDVQDSNPDAQKGIFTETLARIYMKQGKFEQAIEIIQRLSLKYPKKNRYFADQLRFLQKLVINNKQQQATKNS